MDRSLPDPFCHSQLNECVCIGQATALAGRVAILVGQHYAGFAAVRGLELRWLQKIRGRTVGSGIASTIKASIC
jgi:hypothetical protein